VVEILFLYVLFFEKTFYIDLIRLVELVFLLLFDVLVYHIADLLISHIVLFDLIGDFVEYAFVFDRDSKQGLLKILICESCKVISWDLFILGQCSEY